MFIDSETNQAYSYGNVPKLIKKLPLIMILFKYNYGIFILF